VPKKHAILCPSRPPGNSSRGSGNVEGTRLAGELSKTRVLQEPGKSPGQRQKEPLKNPHKEERRKGTEAFSRPFEQPQMGTKYLEDIAE